MSRLAPHASGAARRDTLLVAAVTTILLLPFAGKAFHVDDPLFLKAALQIRSSPLDFYGFRVNWYGTEQPMWEVTKNPPLASYFLALASGLGGWSEIPLHLAFLLPAVAAAAGTLALARRFCAHPVAATLAAVATPAFLVSSTNVMCDVLLVAFWVWAVELWIRGVERRSSGGGAAGTLWFEGHWGFQHYMEARGAQPLDWRRSRLARGDRVAIPIDNANVVALPADAVVHRAVSDVPVLPFLATLSPRLRAGFYLDAWGPLPFAFGRVPPERYVLLEVVREVPPGEMSP